MISRVCILIYYLIKKRTVMFVISHFVFLLFTVFYVERISIYLVFYLYSMISIFLAFRLSSKKTDALFLKMYNIDRTNYWVLKYGLLFFYVITINILIQFI